jgi:beta-glucosidase-like glycosyl hydrolase
MRTIVLTCFIAVLLFPLHAPAQHEDRDEIRALVDSLSLHALIGQTLMVGFYAAGDVEASNQGLKELIARYNIGNVILFKYNFPPQYSVKNQTKIPRSIAKLTNALQATAFSSQNAGGKIPLLIAVDQEGGGVVRVQKGVTRIPAHAYLGAARSTTLAQEAGAVIGTELRPLGINTVLAPVADIHNGNGDDSIGRRAFGANKDIVTALSVPFMQGLQQGGVLSIAKHFPGHGNSTDDPHLVATYMGYADGNDLEHNDLVPFKTLIEHDVDGILTSHVVAEPWDRDHPVSMSKEAISGQLRGTLGFQGIVTSDDITVMVGMLKNEQGEMIRDRIEVALKAYEAGTDVLILARISLDEDDDDPNAIVTKEEFHELYAAIFHYFNNNEERIEQLRDSVERIVRAKSRLYGFPNFQALDTWKVQFKRCSYKRMLKKNRTVAEQIARESAVLISEEGNLIHDIEDSRYFANGKGPLTKRVLIDRNDRIVLASPVFYPPDGLYRTIKKGWLRKRAVEDVRLIYGWRSPAALQEAERLWKEKVEILFEVDDLGEVLYNEEAIENKAQEIITVSEGKKLLIFGVVTGAHARILEEVCEHFKESEEIHIVILLFREPSVLPQALYRQVNTIVLFLSPLPDMTTAGDILYGEVKPKPVSYLPLAIPGNLSEGSGLFF